MKRKNVLVFGLSFALLCMTGCSDKNQNKSNVDKECIYQTALLQSLMLGDYYGSVSVEELKKIGDTGIGTFDKLNGELIMLDGTVYSALSDGSIKEMPDDMTVPFSDVTFLDNEYSKTIPACASMEELKQKLTEIIDEYGGNYFYMAKLEGDFNYVQFRSEYEQEEPYKPLADVMLTDQVVFEEKNISGTLVALYCPDYMDGINTPGWHFHFISSDKTKGGHVLEVDFSELSAVIDKTENFKMTLPEEEFFKDTSMTPDLEDAIESVEK